MKFERKRNETAEDFKIADAKRKKEGHRSPGFLFAGDDVDSNPNRGTVQRGPDVPHVPGKHAESQVAGDPTEIEDSDGNKVPYRKSKDRRGYAGVPIVLKDANGAVVAEVTPR